MERRLKTVMAGAAFSVIAATLGACGDGPKGVAPTDMGTYVDGPKDCMLAKAQRQSDDLAENKGAAFIFMNESGSFDIGYPNRAFQEELDGLTTKSQFAERLAGATRADMRFYPTSRNRPSTPPNPLDIITERNSTFAFRLMPSAWSFRNDGFSLKGDPRLKGLYSPFTPSVNGNASIAMVDFDREALTPQEKCTYTYQLNVNVKSDHSGLISRLPIILDPDWGTMPPSWPPGGPGEVP